MKQLLILAAVCMLAVSAMAENIRGIDIEFVTIGNPGNMADTQVMSWDFISGFGSVAYNYRIGKYEITNAQWNTFIAINGAPTGNPSVAYDKSAYFTGNLQPTNNISWYEAAQFCNYLTSGDKHSGAYKFDLSGNFLGIDRASSISTYGTTYVLPTEDEWYKAAYFKPDGSGYSLYANGLNSIPADNGWNCEHGQPYGEPWDIGTGFQEQNGTYDMMGNVEEWVESLFFEYDYNARGIRGGSYESFGPASYARGDECYNGPAYQKHYTGFRIASIPEPCTLLLLGVGGMVFKKK